MKKKINLILATVFIIGMLSTTVFPAGYLKLGDIKAKGEIYMKIDFAAGKMVSIKAKGNKGNFYITVTNSKGKVVARGTNSIKFRTDKSKSYYKFEITNVMKRRQSLELSWKVEEGTK